MNNNLTLIEKAIEIFNTTVAIEKLNSIMSDLLCNREDNAPQLLKLQDELFSKRLQLKELEQEYKNIKEECCL